MPLIHYTAQSTPFDVLRRAIADHPKDAPVIVMIHGYKFAPHSDLYCPFRDIFSPLPPPRARAVSWPRHLGLGRSAAGAEPLCIAIGWPSRGVFWQATRRARGLGAELAAMLALLAARGHRPGIMAHSLGAMVALSGLAQAQPGHVGRVVLMAGAVFTAQARRAKNSPAGRSAEILNITSRENAFYDLISEAAFGLSGRSIGRGLPNAPEGWLDLRIDDPDTRVALRRLGFPIAAPARTMCHWSGYLRPGLFRLYRAWLGGPQGLPLARLATQAAVLPGPSRRRPWARSAKP